MQEKLDSVFVSPATKITLNWLLQLASIISMVYSAYILWPVVKIIFRNNIGNPSINTVLYGLAFAFLSNTFSLLDRIILWGWAADGPRKALIFSIVCVGAAFIGAGLF